MMMQRAPKYILHYHARSEEQMTCAGYLLRFPVSR